MTASAVYRAMNPLGVDFRAVSFCYGSRMVFSGLTLNFPAKSIVGILGPSGCGKTTFLKCASGLLNPSSGEILLGDTTPNEAQLRGYIGMGFQSATLFPWRSALKNVYLPLQILGRKSSDDREFAKQLLAELEMGQHTDRFPWELSGGQQQRIALARALVTRPRYLLLDEPFGALDGFTRERLNQKVRELAVKYGITVLFVTHSVEEAVFLSDNVTIFHGIGNTASEPDLIPIDLESPRTANTRLTKRFFELVALIREKTYIL